MTLPAKYKVGQKVRCVTTVYDTTSARFGTPEQTPAGTVGLIDTVVNDDDSQLKMGYTYWVQFKNGAYCLLNERVIELIE